MFMSSVNAACIPRRAAALTLEGMHDSMRRLLDYARRATEAKRPAERVHEFADIGRRMNVSSAVLTNWKARGISKDGALDAQRAFGCNAWWLLDGTAPQSVEAWPFPLVDRAQWDAADKEERGYIQHAILAAFEQLERQRQATAETLARVVAADPINVPKGKPALQLRGAKARQEHGEGRSRSSPGSAAVPTAVASTEPGST